jgi:hypothetical protein
MTAYDWSHIQNMIYVSILGLAQVAENESLPLAEVG